MGIGGTVSGFGLGNPGWGAPMKLYLSPMGREAPCSKPLPGTQSGDLLTSPWSRTTGLG